MESFNNDESDIQSDDPLLVGLEQEDIGCEARQCRICLDDEEDENECDPLISPCRCKGSQQWVHRKCLDEWRANNADHVAFSKCMECLTDYRLAYHGPSAGRCEYYCYVARDVVVGCTLFQAAMLLLGAFLRFSFDDSGYKAMDGVTIQTTWAQVLLADLVTGLLLVLVLLGAYGSILLCMNKCSFGRAVEQLEGLVDPTARQSLDAPRTTNHGMDSESTPMRPIHLIGNEDEADDPEAALAGIDLASKGPTKSRAQQPPSTQAMNRTSTLPRSSYHNHNSAYVDTCAHDDCCCYCEGSNGRDSSCCEGIHCDCCCCCEGGSSSGSNDCGSDHPIPCVVIVIGAVLAAIGMVVGVLLACVLLRRIFARHLFRLQKRRLAQNYVVQDLSGLDDKDSSSEALATELPPPIAPPADDVGGDIPSKGKSMEQQEPFTNHDTPHEDFLRKLGLME